MILSSFDHSKHIVLCFHRLTCLRSGNPIYDPENCRVILDFVKISEFDDRPCDDDHFLAFVTNEKEQNQLLKFIYDRKNPEIPRIFDKIFLQLEQQLRIFIKRNNQ